MKHLPVIKKEAEKVAVVQVRSAKAIQRLLENMTRQTLGAKLK